MPQKCLEIRQTYKNDLADCVLNSANGQALAGGDPLKVFEHYRFQNQNSLDFHHRNSACTSGSGSP